MSNYWKHKMRGKNPAAIAAMIIFGGAAIVGLAILFGFVIMWLWNWLMPDLFGLTTITYWQGVGLFILAKILIGGCGSGSRSKRSKDWDCEDDSKKKKKSDFSKWKNYDKFWQEEGEQAYDAYVNKMNQPAESADPKPDVNPSTSTEE